MKARSRAAAIALGLVLAVIIFILVAVSSSGRSSPMVRRLPDGSWLKIVSVSYSHNHSYSMPAPTAGRSFLLKHLPSSWTAQLGLWQSSGRVGITAPEGKTNLFIFTVCKQATPTSLCSSPWIDVLDEQGGRVGWGFAGPSSSNWDGKHRRQLVGWYFDSFGCDLPLDPKKMVLRFSELGPDGIRRQVAEFTITNPAAAGK